MSRFVRASYVEHTVNVYDTIKSLLIMVVSAIVVGIVE